MSQDDLVKTWVAYATPNADATMRLFCFAYAGGSASVYRLWRNALPAHVELCPIQLPGRETRMRETPYTSLPPLVDALVEVIDQFSPLPFTFFGHSMGTLVAFELARTLRRQGLPTPDALLVSGRRAPHVPDPTPPISHLPSAQLGAALRRYNGIPEVIVNNPDVFEVFVPSLRGDFSICETYCYRHETPFDIPMTALGGTADHTVSREQLLAWQAHTTGPFRAHFIEGDHFFINSQRDQVLEIVGQALQPHHAVLGTG